MGSTLAAMPVANALAAADDTIHLTRSDIAFTIAYGTRYWTCEMAWFGPRAAHDLRADAEITPDGEPRQIAVKRVEFSGSDLNLSLNFRVGFVDGRAAVALAIPELKIKDEIDLIDWIAGARDFSGNVSALVAASIVKALDHRALSTTGAAAFSFAASGRFGLRGLEAPIGLHANGVRIPVRVLRLAIGKTALPTPVAALDLLAARSDYIPGYVADDRVTVLWAEEATSEGAGGRLASTKTAALELGAMAFDASDASGPQLSMVLADLSPTSDTCVVAKCFSFEATATFAAESDVSAAHVREWPDFKLDAVTLNQIVWGKHSHVWLTGDFRSKPTFRERGHVPLVTSGGNELGLWAESEDDALTVFMAKADLHHAFVPMPGADYSRIDYERTQVDYALEDLSPHQKAAPVSAGYMLACPPVFSAVMGEKAMVRVLRTADLLALKYSFRDLYLISRPGEAYLDSCENCLPGFKLPPGRDPLMIVRFPPQHITEKAYLVVEADDRKSGDVRLGSTRLYETAGGSKRYAELARAAVELATNPNADLAGIKSENLAAAQAERDKDLARASTVVDELLKSLDHVSEARSAGPTRLVFAFNPEAHEADPATRGTPFLPRPYTVSALSYWRGLKAKVAARALRRDASLSEQLRISGVTVDTDVRDKTYVIDRTLTRPTAEDTAMEFPYRLQLSTANDARWHTPPDPTAEQIAAGITLWSARLDPDLGGRSVRALWSPDFDKARPSFFKDKKHPPHSNEAPWRDPPRTTLEGAFPWLVSHKMRMSLDARDRHELVLLSSVYGLPALLPVPDPELLHKTNGDDQKRAESTVCPPPKDYPTATGLLGDEGVFSPQPLSSADIALSSLGATINLQGQWEPPSGFTIGGEVQPLWPALTIERWQHQAFLGRDVFVEVLYKGFLFPLGHRCSVIKSTERKFRADPKDRSGKAPVAYLIQRYFVVVGEPKKPFPVVGQRYGGRAIYTTAITMLTTTSPDIVDPFATMNKPPRDFGTMGGAAFFPKTQPGQGLEGVIHFEYDVEYSDGDKRKLKSPLIVIDNTLAHDPQGISELVGYYNTLPQAMEPGRRVDTANQRMRYADDSKAGGTEFITQEWLLGAQGREIANPVGAAVDATFQFTMDAVMEGADQPPFYPVVAEAKVEVQSLNYMNGQSKGLTAAGYDLNYLHHGFSPARNPSGIFLSLLNDASGKRPTDLVLDGNTAASGGFATPNLKAVAISREKGPVGGKTATKDLNSTLGDGSMIAAAGSPPGDSGSDNFELSLAQAGQFDGLEALVGALKLPKLFGIIPLQSLIPILSFIDGAPEMIESTTYKISDQVDQFADEAAKVAARIGAAIDGATGELDHSLADYSSRLGIDPPLKFADLYPRLAGAFLEVRSSLAKLETAADQFQPAEANKAFAALGATASAVRKTLAEIKRVAKNPTPAIVDTFIGKLNDALKPLGESLKTVVLAEIPSYVSELSAALRFSVTLQCVLDENDQPTLDVVVIDPPQVNLQDSLYPFLVAVLVGRPDNWQIVATAAGKVGRQVVSFDITKFGTLDPTQALRVGEQTLEHALLRDSVTKPLINGYVMLSRIAEAFEKDAGDIERHLHELPRQITAALISWTVGLMGLERVYALAHEFLADADPRGLLADVLEMYADPLVKLPSFAAQADDLRLTLSDVIDALDVVLNDPRVPPGTRSAISQSRVRLAKLRQRLDATLDDFEVLRGELEAKAPSQIVREASLADLAATSATVAAALGKFTASQAAALMALNDTVVAAQDALTIVRDSAASDVSWVVLERLAGTLAAAEQGLLRFVASLIVHYNKSGTLVSPAKHILDKVDQEIDGQLDAAATDLTALTDQILQATIDAAGALLGNAPTEAEVGALLERGLTFIGSATDAMVKVTDTAGSIMGLATRGMTLGKAALDAADQAVFPKLKPILVRALTFLAGPGSTSLYGLAKEVNSKLNLSEWDAAAVKTLKLFLDKRLFEILADPSIGTTIDDERATIDAARAAIESADSLFDFALPPATGGPPRNEKINALIKLAQIWIRTAAVPAPARALEPVQQLADLLLHGKIADLVDLDGLRRELEDSLGSFIPAQVSFDYEWGVPLKSFPSESSKIFWIDQERRENKPNFPISEAFKDKLATRKDSNDLTLYARAGVDLRDPAKPKPIFEAEGDIRYFNVNLFSPSFDVVTVKFDQLRFTLDKSGSDFHVILAKNAVKFGPVVSFIEAMSGFLGGKSGIYLNLIFDPLGIVIGYHYEQERIPLGTLALLNFAIDISVELTFDGSPVAFRFALAERNKPLAIICTPYGGAGYLALQTVASDIVDFQMQLEFGGAVAINFGPLNANGFVSAGIYIEKHKGQDLILEGFVRAIGEGTIVCFTISVFFEVRMHQQGSDVSGQITVMVSFKVGFAQISYGYTAAYQFAGKGGGGSLLADGKIIKVDVANRLTDWKKYRRYFAALAA